MDPITAIILVIIIVIVVVAAYFIVMKLREGYTRKEILKEKYGRVPDHMELYFEEYFPSIMKEWDIVTKTRLQRWTKTTRQQMTSIDRALDDILGYRKGLDGRLDSLEKDISGLEKRK